MMKEVKFNKYYQDRALRSIKNERWVPVYHEDFEEFYEVSNKGRIKSLPREKRSPTVFVRYYKTEPRILKQALTKKKGRIVDARVQLNCGSYVKMFQVSRLVYFSFNRNEDPETEDLIIKKNKIGFDNRLRNLFRGDRSTSRQIDMEKSELTIKHIEKWKGNKRKGQKREIPDDEVRRCKQCQEDKLYKKEFRRGRHTCYNCETKNWTKRTRRKTKQNNNSEV